MDQCNEGRDQIYHKRNKTWKLVKKPTGVKLKCLKWVYKIKRNTDGTVIKYKARLAAKGYVQQQGIDFDEVFAPVAQIEPYNYSWR